MINCKDTKCQKGFYRCCATCELLEVCDTACYNPSAKCGYAELTPTERRRAYKQQKQTRNITIACIIVIALILSIGLFIIGNQNTIMMMQTDAINLTNYIQQDIEDLKHQPKIDDLSTTSLTDEERNFVERVTAAEARGETLEGMMAVALTILDRSELWNLSITEVLTAPGQYADPYQGEISDSVRLAVANVFDNGIRVFEDPITHFFSGDKPYWADEKVNRGSIGCHEFYY